MKVTDKYWDLIAHSLGINLYNAQLSKRKKDKRLPLEFYRNYFCSSKGSDEHELLEELEKYEYTKSCIQHGNIYFMVTEKGVSEFREYFLKNVTQKFIPLSKSAENYQNYLDADTGGTYEEYLGITPPKREYDRDCKVRLVSRKYESVKGVFCETIKDAKISYKESLKNYKRSLSCVY